MSSQIDAVCPWCGFHYKELKTGLSYGEVYGMLWSGSENPKDWRYKRRNTVLGKWYQIKQGMWDQHLKACEAMNEIGVSL